MSSRRTPGRRRNSNPTRPLIGNRGAWLVSGSGLFKDITSRDVGERDDLRLSISEIAWTGPARVVL
jgi:hypothetical protein